MSDGSAQTDDFIWVLSSANCGGKSRFSRNAKDYTAVIVFIIAIDRVTKIWPEEKERLKAFSHKVAKRIKSGSAKP